MKIPEKDECLRFMDDHDMFERIKRHSKRVSEVSLYIAKKLNQKSPSYSLELVSAAGLLHDLTKTYEILHRHKNDELYLENKTRYDRTLEKYYHLAKLLNFDPNIPHNLSAYHLLKFLGYETLGAIVKEHTNPDITEISYEGILAYSDRIILDQSIVTIDERFSYIEQRYPHIYNYSEFNEFKNNTKKLEQKLQSKGNFSLDELKEQFK